ncbi:receptor-interacting serine/threonine-protein kinase 2-like isoform X1 [Dendrobates tinctorius]|uniref:receptor-interacting serine/threonine-protein kinase 2-like isoform X1 n=1 Tax=Dendrobates tinctorius TaxID=92724 RepID=UPI003CCA334A
MAEMSLPVISQRDLKTYQIVKTSTEYVCKSTYPTAGSFVFIKLLALNEQNHRDHQAILNDVEYVSSKRSESLLKIVGIFRTLNTVGIVTEWMPNGSLHTLLYQRDLYPTLPLSIIIRILRDVAAGMSFLYSQHPPIMILRLKPCNILLDAQYRAKLSDFWQSELQKVSFSKDQQENISVEYLSPQRLQKREPTTADDVYSLGIILHEALSRKQPFLENNPLKLVTEITRGIRPQPNIEDVIKEASLQHSQLVNLSQLMHLCWHQNPMMRPTAAVCASRLNNVLQNFSKEEIQHGIDTLNKSKEKAEQQSQEQVMEFDIKFLDVGWLTRSHMTRTQSLPEESTEDHSLCPGTKKEKRSASLPVSSSKTNIPIPTTCPDPRAARNCGLHRKVEGRVEDCVSSLHLVYSRTYTETLKRNWEVILNRVTEGHLNNLIDTMRTKFVLSRDDYENIHAERTLKARIRKCLETCSEKGEEASKMFLDSLCSRNVIHIHPRNPA